MSWKLIFHRIRGARGKMMTSRKPIVSLLMPVYNSAKFLPATLENALSQTLKSIEIVAVDDGSTDDSLQILQEFQRKDSRLRILKNHRNEGINISRIRALRAARGEFILSLDSDDKLESTLAKQLLRKARSTGVDVVGFRHRILMGNSKVAYAIRDKFLIDAVYSDPLDVLIKRNMLNSYLSIHFIRRECYLRGIEKLGEEFHRWNSVLREDLVHFAAALSEAKSIVFVNNTGYHYCIQKVSASKFVKNDSQERAKRALESSLSAIFWLGRILAKRSAKACFEFMINGPIMRDVEFFGQILTPENLADCIQPYLKADSLPFGVDFKAILMGKNPKEWEMIAKFC